MRSRLAALRTAALVSLVACGGGLQADRTEDPASVAVRDYLRALSNDDPRAAWEMLSKDARTGMTYEEFEEIWRDTKAERAYQGHALEEGLRGGDDLGERAKVKYADGKTVSLHRENGAWRLEAGLVSQTHAGGPRDAIQIFAEALADKSYEGVMRILTSRRRQRIGEHVESFASSLQEHMDDKIAHIGKDRAELQWDDDDTRYKIVLRKEGEEWRVDDVHIRPEPDDEDGEADAGEE